MPTSHRVVVGGDGGPVVVKTAEGRSGAQRLAAEAAALALLDHPATVQVVAHVDDQDAPELHLSWVGPHTLATITAVPVAAAARVVARVAATVADVHLAGMSHRRLTPDHVLLGPDGRPVLTGFADAVAAVRVSPTDDVAALGALLTALVAPSDGALHLPERRRGRGRDDGLRAALLTLADHVQVAPPSSRPTAADLAMALRTAVGDPPLRAAS